MSTESELNEIKRILGQIRDSQSLSTAPPTQGTKDLDKYTRELKLARNELDLLEKGSGAYNRKLREVERLTDQTRDAMKQQRREADSLSVTMGVLSDASSMLAGALDKVILKGAELIKNVFDEAKKLDTLTVNFQATTGASEKLASNIGVLTDRLRLYGITSEKSRAITETMQNSFTAFTHLNQDQQAEVGRTAAVLGELGVSYQTTAQIFETGTRTLGMSLGEAESLIVDLRQTAVNLQVPIEQLTRDFAGAGNQVIALGHAGPKAFKDLAAASKATGVEMSSMLKITEQFDTYEGAANAVQKLNSVLRTNALDVQTMLEETDPAKRFLAIRDAVLNAGYSVEQLSDKRFYFLKKAMADAIGTDVPNFMKMLSGDVDELIGSVDSATVSFEELSEQAFGLKGFDQVMNNMMGMLERPVQRIQKATRDSFAAFKPLISRFERFNEDLINKTNTFVNKNSEMVGAVGLLYNLANIDGVRKGYEIFKGMASFSASILGNFFSLKGLLLTGVAFAAYQIRGSFDKIKKAFDEDGFMGGLNAIWDALSERFAALQDYLDKEFGLNKNFLNKGKNVLKTLAIEGYHMFNVNFLQPFLSYVKNDMIPVITVQIKRLFNNFMKFVNDNIGGGLRTILFGTTDKAAVLKNLLKSGLGIQAEEKEVQEKLDPEAALNRAVAARKAAVADFMGTRAVKTAELKADQAVQAVTPYVEKVGETMNKVATYAGDKFESGLRGAAEIVGEGVARQKHEHYITANVDEDFLNGATGRAVESKLDKMGRSALMNRAR